jgi:hypothetical protein
MAANLRGYAGRGVGTLNQLTARWAPAGDGANDPAAYARSISQATGIDPNAPIDLTDPDTLRKIIPAMARVEQGHPVLGIGNQGAQTDVTSPYWLNDWAKTSLAARNAIAGSSIANDNRSSTSELHIGSVNVTTSASTMSGTGDDMGRALQNSRDAAQADYGPS